MLFRLKIKELRKTKGISQQKLADILNLDQTMISAYEVERNIPSLKRTIEIAQALDVTLDELIEFKEVHKKTSQEYIDMIEDVKK